MRAFVFQKSGAPLAVQDVDDSSPAAGYVVVAVKRRGTCDTDPLAIVKLGASQPGTNTVVSGIHRKHLKTPQSPSQTVA